MEISCNRPSENRFSDGLCVRDAAGAHSTAVCTAEKQARQVGYGFQTA
ncbi:hypothetical protein [Neisseria elongata]|nr:hypothetical protein [Neisseria elongata]